MLCPYRGNHYPINMHNLLALSIFIFYILILHGCAEPESMVAADKLKFRTQPQEVSKELRRVGLCYRAGGTPSKIAKYKLSDLWGLSDIPLETVFEGGPVPEGLIAGNHLFAVEDDPIHFMTKMTFISLNVFKRTNIEYNHQLMMAGPPVLRDDAIMAAVGTTGSPEKGPCYLAVLDLLGEQVKRIVPPNVSADELKTGRVVPVMWDGNAVRTILALKGGRAVYFAAEPSGKITGSVNLEGAYISAEEKFSGWRVTSPGGALFLVGIRDGYFLIDEKTWKANYFGFTTVTKILGVTSDGHELLVTAFDNDLKHPAVYRRFPIGGTNGEAIPYGPKGAASIPENVVFSAKKNCIFFVDGKDIWRMDLYSGIQGKLFENPGQEGAQLLWAW
jgi:hypothetical protein